MLVEYSELHWEGSSLFHGRKDTTVKLVQDEKYSFMYWLKWNFEKPEESMNFYNLVNAKDNARVLYLRHMNNDTERASTEVTGAFKQVGSYPSSQKR